MSAVMVSVTVLIRTFSSGINTHPVSWNFAYRLRVELSDGGCFPNLMRNCRWTIVPRRSFWITLYILTGTRRLKKVHRVKHVRLWASALFLTIRQYCSSTGELLFFILRCLSQNFEKRLLLAYSHLCPSVRPKWNNSATTGLIFTTFDIWGFFKKKNLSKIIKFH